MLSTQQADDDSRYVFVAKLDNARNVSTILKAIHFKEESAPNSGLVLMPFSGLKSCSSFAFCPFLTFTTTATVFVTSQGLKVTVEDAKCVQANAFIQAAVFHHFVLTQDQVTFKVNLSVLIECLTIFGSGPGPSAATSMKMCYEGYGRPLVVMLEEEGVLTDCSLKTLEPDEVLDFDFCSTNVINKIIMKSECLKEVFSELDTTSDVLQILMSPDAPYLQLSTFGNAGSTHSSFSKDSDMVEAFQCTQTQSNRYKMQLLRPSSKALALSTRISIRTDARGFLSLQYMIKNDDGQVCFVEFFCAPDEEMDEPGH